VTRHPQAAASPSALLTGSLAALWPQHEAHWARLGSGRLFLAGGSGLFGVWLLHGIDLARRRLGLNLEVTLLSRNPAAFARQHPELASAPWLHCLAGDVRDFQAPTGAYDWLIHGATTSAQETFAGESSLNKFDLLVQGTRHLLDFAARQPLRRLLFLSSGAVYGPQPAGTLRIDECNPAAPQTTDRQSGLAQGKRAAEYLCSEYAARDGYELVIARCFSFAGPLLPTRLHYAFGNFIAQALEQPEIVIQGDGLPLRAYLYLADLVGWLVALLGSPAAHGVYNVGSDQALSIAELAGLIRDELAPGKPVRILGDPAAGTGNPVRNSYVPEIELARRELGLAVWTPLTAMIHQTAASFRLNPAL
jgi:dTDP-glucose 4,6-dehydratase/UDP-glucose 4-epimerase